MTVLLVVVIVLWDFIAFGLAWGGVVWCSTDYHI